MSWIKSSVFSSQRRFLFFSIFILKQKIVTNWSSIFYRFIANRKRETTNAQCDCINLAVDTGRCFLSWWFEYFICWRRQCGCHVTRFPQLIDKAPDVNSRTCLRHSRVMQTNKMAHLYTNGERIIVNIFWLFSLLYTKLHHSCRDKSDGHVTVTEWFEVEFDSVCWRVIYFLCGIRFLFGWTSNRHSVACIVQTHMLLWLLLLLEIEKGFHLYWAAATGWNGEADGIHQILTYREKKKSLQRGWRSIQHVTRLM